MASQGRNFPLDSPVRISPDVVSRDLHGEEVILNLSTGIYFGLDPLGTQIWHLLKDAQSVKSIINTLLKEYDVTEKQLHRDVSRLLAEFQQNRLIQYA